MWVQEMQRFGHETGIKVNVEDDCLDVDFSGDITFDHVYDAQDVATLSPRINITNVSFFCINHVKDAPTE